MFKKRSLGLNCQEPIKMQNTKSKISNAILCAAWMVCGEVY